MPEVRYIVWVVLGLLLAFKLWLQIDSQEWIRLNYLTCFHTGPVVVVN